MIEISEELKDELFLTLKEKSIKLSTAESCTGGMIGSYLTSIPGISQYYGYGFITYSNEAKMHLLGVKKETLEKYGAVSSFTAVEMANGARSVSKSDIAISVTGIAGPGGGTKEKKVGLVYVGFSSKKGSFFKELSLSGSRDEIRKQTCINVFELIINELRK